MRLNFIPKTDDKWNMNNELIEALIELSNKLPENEVQFANIRMACVVAFYMQQMEEEGTPITQESLLRAFKEALEKHRKMEELEKNSKTA